MLFDHYKVKIVFDCVGQQLDLNPQVLKRTAVNKQNTLVFYVLIGHSSFQNCKLFKNLIVLFQAFYVHSFCEIKKKSF